MSQTDRPAAQQVPQSSPEDLINALRERGIRNKRVLEAFQRVRREYFVPREWIDIAYLDQPIPIPHGQVTTQPSLIAQMVEALRLTGRERVLEVGTGLGFQTAILSVLAREVVSIERFSELAEQAERNLQAANIKGVTIVVGDGTQGLPQRAPFDGIIVSAAAPEVPQPLIEQLAEGGRIVHPLGPGGREIVTVFRKQQGRLVKEADLTPACFVPLVGAYGLTAEP